MSLFEPKIIYLDNNLVLTGENTLIFLTLDEFNIKKTELLEYVTNSFMNKIDFDSQFKADSDTLSVSIIPTTDCNLNCIYCYSDGGCEKINLNFDFVKLFIDMLISKNQNCKFINLYFAGGGEPLLNFNLIKQIVDYTINYNLIPHIRIVTNGILVPLYIDWLKANNVYLRISYDGSAQNINRPGNNFDSKKMVENTLQLLSDSYPLTLLSVQMTITKSNVQTIQNDVENIIKQYKINTIKIEPVHPSVSTKSKLIDLPSVEEFSENILKTLDNLISKNINARIDLSYVSAPSTSYFCSVRNKAVITPFKVITPCVEIINSAVLKNLILWDGKNNLDFNNISKIQHTFLYDYHPKSDVECANCNLVHLCKGTCPMRRILNHNKKYNFNCEVSKVLIPEFLIRVCKNEKYMNLLFGDNFKEENKCD